MSEVLICFIIFENPMNKIFLTKFSINNEYCNSYQQNI